MISEGYENSDVLIVTTNQGEENWILESGCTFHMTPNRSWFDVYNRCDGAKVIMGNDAQCLVIGVGIIKIKMAKNTIKTITDVVSGLKRNLTSLGSLDSKGCTYGVVGGVL